MQNAKCKMQKKEPYKKPSKLKKIEFEWIII